MMNKIINNNQPFHMVTQSPWPLILSISMMNLFMSTSIWFNQSKFMLLIINLILMMMIMMQWWRDINREATFQGCHTMKTQTNMKIGMIMFISSEILFFISFFWAFFHSFLSPSIEIGNLWPPMNIEKFNSMSIPLLNTLILITSGISLTWSHHSIIKSKFKKSKMSLMITIMLGIYFTSIQLIEYFEAPFSISDSIFGSTFFMTTGFHGFHVIIGTLFLTSCLMKLMNLNYSKKHHFSFEAASWYWHFVDIVWLFLFLSMY
uniref:Cytochrome c oxidase subunit 3 n=1 Tax=Cephalonomia gallicola TaxID=627714 RepID=E0WCE7_9HYME|nr:cytochrome c oxidase subunit III [Cephalonomia gallicola]